MPRSRALFGSPLVVVVATGALACCEPPAVDHDLLSGLRVHEAQRHALCARGRHNAVTAAFCGTSAPAVTGLVDVEKLLGVAFSDTAGPSFALTTHSTSLVERSVSPLNPRAVIVQQPSERADHNALALTFTRGDPFVEMAVMAPGAPIDFYLLRYERGCDALSAGCPPSVAFTGATESGWKNWSLYDDNDVKNTVLDCLACHEPQHGEGRIFRMQELANPWTHWIASFTDGGNALFTDFLNAHRDEQFAGIPANLIATGSPVNVEDFIKALGQGEQPNAFPSQQIENEVKASNAQEPVQNVPPGKSSTWDSLYTAAVEGTAIPPPYHDVKITDASKLAAMTQAYVDFSTGKATDLPDVSDVFLDAALADMSIKPKAGLDGRGILVHACAQCHNERLDQHLTRARFDPKKIDELPASEKQLAIDRLQRPADDRFRMPPHLIRDLDDDQLQAAIAVLR